MLEKLSAQVKTEGETEAVEYAKFSQWCTDLIGSKEAAIKKSEEEMAVSTAQIQALETDIAALTEEIGDLETEITKDGAAQTKMSQNRDDENGEYLIDKKDLEDTITALDEAIQEMESSLLSKSAVMKKVAVKKALELIRIYRPDATKKVTQFMQRAEQEPDSPTYESKTGGVTEILKDLKTKFETKLKELNESETNAVSAHALADAAKTDEIEAGTAAKDTKTEVKGRKGGDLATAQASLQESTEARDTAATVLKTTKDTCTTRASEWEERSSRRAGEIEAMKKAVSILKEVTSVRTPDDKGVETTFSGTDGVFFLQKVNDPRAKIVNLLRKAAGKAKGAKELVKLADRIASMSKAPGDSVFAEIKNMIEKMIFRLMREQKDEDDHKNWCDKELTKTNMTIDEKETKKEELQTSIDSLTAQIATLEADIKQNTIDISAMESAIATAVEDRQAESAENKATIKDAQDAQNAVSNAIAVLEDFYKNIGGIPKADWELAQVSRSARRVKSTQDPEAPSAGFEAGDSYTGTSGGTAVVDLLTQVATDFASMEAQAKSDETTQQDEHDQWMTATKVSKAAAEKDSEMKSARKLTLSQKLEGKMKDKDHNDKELEATEEYMTNLQPACVEGDSTYEERKAARTTEIEALKSAETILDEAFNE
jgi:chromosome segregation ATPase